MDQPKEISPAVESALDNLSLLDPAIIKAGKRLFAQEMFLPDLFVVSVLNRTMQLLHGFVGLVHARNYLSATPLFRLQLDNGLRLWAGSLVENFDDFTSKVLKGVQINRIKSKSGEKLTDHYLVTTLSKFLGLPKLPEVYNYASGFIHLSGQHIFATNRIDNGGKLAGHIGRWDDVTDEAKWLDLIHGFSSATDIVLTLVNYWAIQKDEERSRRD